MTDRNIGNVGCVCYRMPYNKLIENIKKLRPQNASEFSRKCLAGSACGMCVPYIEKYIKESNMKTVCFKETQNLVFTVHNELGKQTAVMEWKAGVKYQALSVEDHGEYSDIVIDLGGSPIYLYLIPNESFEVIS